MVFALRTHAFFELSLREQLVFPANPYIFSDGRPVTFIFGAVRILWCQDFPTTSGLNGYHPRV